MQGYRTGMDVLLAREGALSDLGRIGLVAHPASVNAFGVHSALLLRERVGERLTCLLGPEHGFFGAGAPGEPIAHQTHPEWGIPIYSLYGDVEDALTHMRAHMDTLIFDLQDLGVRCYTYVHTLRQVLEACSRHKVRCVVTDRAVPHADGVDGPCTDPAFASIVAPVATPMVYGMTPGETARWLIENLGLDVECDVVAAEGYQRGAAPGTIWKEWVPPSPAIRSWMCAMCFPVTVFTEALKQFDCARQTPMAFRLLRAPWLEADAVCAALQARDLPGVFFARYHDVEGDERPALQLRVTDPSVFKPAVVAVTLLYELQQAHGVDAIWQGDEVDTRWFDRLWGTDRVRLQLCDGVTPEAIAATWTNSLSAFQEKRASARLYP